MFEISAYILNRIFTKNVNTCEITYHGLFPNFRALNKPHLELSSFISASLKSIVTIQLTAQNALVKQIVEQCRRTILPQA